MVVPAQRGEVAFAGDPALVPGLGVVEVAPGGWAGAARRGAPGAAGGDSVPQLAAGLVAGFGPGVVARAADERGERDGQRAGGPGAGPGGAAVGGGGAVGGHRG